MNPINNNTTVLTQPTTQATSKTRGNFDNISDECKQHILQLKAKNRELLPKKLNQGRLTFIGVASLISVIAGIILTAIGIGFSVTGAGIPLGIALVTIGIGSVALGFTVLKYFGRLAARDEAVKRNKAKMLILKKLMSDRDFRTFTVELHQEMRIKHLTVPVFAANYGITKLYDLYQVSEKERLMKPRKRDPAELIHWNYRAYLNFTQGKVDLANKMLKEMNDKIRQLNKGSTKNPSLNQQKKVLLDRAKKLSKVRPSLIKNAPRLTQMSVPAYTHLQGIRISTKQRFPYVDLKK